MSIGERRKYLKLVIPRYDRAEVIIDVGRGREEVVR